MICLSLSVPAVGVHPLMPAQVGELCVALEAHLTAERLDAAVYVRVLLQPTTRGKSLSALRTGVASGPHVAGTDVPLKVARVREHLVAVLTRKSPKFSVDHFVSKKVRSPCEALIAVFAHIFLCLVSVAVHHVLVQTEERIDKEWCE